MERAGILRPIEDARASIEALRTYRTPEELRDALIRTRDAVDETLRLLLRATPDAPDSARMSALSPERLASSEVLATLRRTETISIELAGRVHDLEAAAERAASGNVQAADADRALATVQLLATEIAAAERPQSVASAPADPGIPLDGGPADPVPERRRALWPVALAVVILLVAIAALLRGGKAADLDAGVQAFREGRFEDAEQIFRAAADAGSEDPGVWLYLGRIYRRSGRPAEAADALRVAIRLDENDADVRRELGYLFLDLGRPEPAAEQFRRAQELEPEDSAAWIGLIRALRAAGDPQADELLKRAPASVRERLGGPRDSATTE